MASLSAMLAGSSDRASSSCRDNTVMTASNSPRTGTTSRLDEFAHHPFITSPTQMPEWPYERDVMRTFELSRRVTSANPRSNMLQRGSSAPSRLFEECLADFQSEEVIAPRLSDPFMDIGDDILAWADQNLAPIVESGAPLQMETEVRASAEASSSLASSSQQVLDAQAGFQRRISSIATQSQSLIGSEVVEAAQVGGYGAVPALRETMGPSFDNQMASIVGASEEIYGGGSSSTVLPAYPAAPDHQISYSLSNELLPGGSALWNSSATPVSAGMIFEGNRPLLGGQGNSVEPPSGWLQGSTTNAVADPVVAPMTSPGGLIRHSSLPANYVPGRAIRGHATHPRSVAERVRRGKISERMKRLQDLVPDMEPQSNTADMLDEVVEYVKQLKLKVEELSQTVVQLKRAMHPD